MKAMKIVSADQVSHRHRIKTSVVGTAELRVSFEVAVVNRLNHLFGRMQDFRFSRCEKKANQSSEEATYEHHFIPMVLNFL